MRWFLIAALCGFMYGCITGCTPAEPQAIAEAKRAIAHDLLDPEAAKFRNVYVVPGSAATVCGEVNGKNSFGAYTGYRKFVYAKDQQLMSIDGDDRTGYLFSGADILCGRDEPEVRALLVRMAGASN